MGSKIGFDIAGILGLLIAVILGYLEWHRYHLPLRMAVKAMFLVDSSEDTRSFLLLACFVNPASQGKTIFEMKAEVPGSKGVEPCSYQFDENLKNAKLILPTGETAWTVPIPELLQLPLDIPPHQSVAKWWPFLIRINQAEKESKNKLPLALLQLTAYDVNGKELAKIEQKFDLTTQVTQQPLKS